MNVLLLWNLTDVNPVILLCWSERINKCSILFFSIQIFPCRFRSYGNSTVIWPTQHNLIRPVFTGLVLHTISSTFVLWPNSGTKSSQKSQEFSSLLFIVTSALRFLFFSNSRNLLQLLYENTVKEKGGKPDR
jgi:hypothetical protein